MEIDHLDETARSGNSAKLHDATAEIHGDAVAVESRGRTLTHAQLRAASERFAGGLRELGLDPGDPLLLYLPNCPQYLVASLGCFRAGVPVSPVNPQYRRRELAYQFEDTDAAAVLTHATLRGTVDEAFAAAGRDVPVVTVGDEASEGDVPFDDVRGDATTVERADDDVAMLPYTSGTTGRPKGVRLTHRNIRSQLLPTLTSRADRLDDEAVRSLIWLPLYHITGFTHTALQPLVRGGRLYVRSPANWDAEEAMATIEREAITHFVGVTAMYVDLVGADGFGDYDLSSLVVAGEGGAKMSVSVQREFETTAGVEMVEGYGLTETNGATHSQQGATFGPRRGTVGQPLRHTDCRIVDDREEDVPPGEEGELLVRGPHVMAGYHGKPDATDEAFTENGYFRTGDIARRDADNYYEIVDRKKHVIVTAGYNVYPSEIEELLAEHGAIAEAAVVGVPHERRNEVPKAFVVPNAGVEADVDLTAEDVEEYCLDSVAAYKHPREVEFVDELPRTASGKVRKHKLEERHESGEDGDEVTG